LAAKPVPGRPPKLDPADRRKILDLLLAGPTHHGFGTELWTLARAAQVIERHLDVRYHPSQVWRILRALDWSCQKPQSAPASETKKRSPAGGDGLARIKKSGPNGQSCCFWMKRV